MSFFLGFLLKSEKFNQPNITLEYDKSVVTKDHVFYFKDGFDVSMWHENGLLIFFSGFFSNTEELRAQYLVNNVSDIELLATMYEKNEQEFYKSLSGNFSFCIFDEYEDKLFLLRDQFGARPIYFIDKREYLAFSSDLNTLVKSNISSLHLNRASLIDFLCFRVRSAKSTFYKEIQRLDPSLLLLFDGACISLLVVHQRLPVKNNKTKKSAETIKQFSERFENALIKSNFHNMRIGIMLSGGLDSSAISAGMHKIGLSDLSTFSANFEHLPERQKSLTDETKYQLAVSEAIGSKHFFCPLELVSPMKSLEKLLDYYSEPTHFPNVYIWDVIMAKAKEHEIDLMVTGQDGDNVVSHGNHRFPELLSKFNFFTFVYEIVRYSFNHKRKFFGVLKFVIKEISVKWGLKTKEIQNYSLLKDSLFFGSGIDDLDSQTLVDSHEENLTSPMHPLTFEWRYIYFKNYNMEVRSPFYDKQLINFCLSLPSKWKLRHGMGRYILRRYMRNLLPDFVVDRPGKADLTYGLRHNLNEGNICAIERELMDTHPVLQEIVDIDKLKAVLERLKNNRGNVPVSLSQNDIMSAFSFFIVNRWLNKNKDLLIT